MKVVYLECEGQRVPFRRVGLRVGALLRRSEKRVRRSRKLQRLDNTSNDTERDIARTRCGSVSMNQARHWRWVHHSERPPHSHWHSHSHSHSPEVVEHGNVNAKERRHVERVAHDLCERPREEHGGEEGVVVGLRGYQRGPEYRMRIKSPLLYDGFLRLHWRVS